LPDDLRPNSTPSAGEVTRGAAVLGGLGLPV